MTEDEAVAKILAMSDAEIDALCDKIMEARLVIAREKEAQQAQQGQEG